MTNHILKNDGKTLKGLFQKVDQLREFNRIFAQYAEPGIVAHCKIANLQNNCLIVIVDSGSWATQLRFLIPDLLAKMRQHVCLAGLKSICCKTRPDPAFEKPRKRRNQGPMKQMSVATSEEILRSAKTIEDKKLREILERIAGRIK